MCKKSEKPDMLQHYDVPRCIRYLSVIYIGLTIGSGLLNLIITIVEEGGATMNQLSYVINTFGKVPTGFLFWGTGQVFSKLTGKDT